MHLRAQTAIEFITTYGWAIVSVVVAIGVLFSLGVFNLGTNTATGCSVVAGFSCTKPVLSSSGILTLGFGQIGITKTITATGCTKNNTAPTTWLGASTTLQSGQVGNFTFYCGGVGSLSSSVYHGTLWVQYSAVGGGTVTQQVGSVSLTPQIAVSRGSDVVVLHSSGSMTAYNAVSSSGADQGNAFGAAVSNEVSGDSIYLRPETYLIQVCPLAASGISILGSGIAATSVVAPYAQGGQDFQCNPYATTTFADLGLYNMSLQNSAGWGPLTLRNVYMTCQYPYACLEMGPTAGSGSLLVEHSTFNSSFTAIWLTYSGAPAATILDSSFILNLAPSQVQAVAVHIGGPTVSNIVNSRVTVLNPQLASGYTILAGVWLAAPGTTATVYGGSINTESVSIASVHDLLGSSGTLNANASVVYNSLRSSGYTTIGGAYGQYSYPTSPQIPANVAILLYGR